MRTVFAGKGLRKIVMMASLLPIGALGQKYIVPFDAVKWQFEAKVDRCILAAKIRTQDSGFSFR